MTLQAVTREKLVLLAGYLEELAVYRPASYEDFEGSTAVQRAVERMIQLVCSARV
jgi:hypothetical protein